MRILGRWEMGFGMEVMRLEEKDLFNNQIVPGRLHRETGRTLTTSIMWNIPVYPLADKLAIGISPAIGLVLGAPVSKDDVGGTGSASNDFGEGGTGGLSIGFVNGPILAMLNYGNDASVRRHNGSFGCGLGVGYQASWIFGSTYVYGMPICAAEIGYYNRVLFKLRGTLGIVPAHFSETTTFAQSNVSLYLTF